GLQIGAAQDGAMKRCTFEIGAGEVGAGQVAPLEVRAGEVGTGQVGAAEERARKRGALEIGPGQVGAGQVAPTEIRAAEVATAAIDGAFGKERVAILRRGAVSRRAHQHRRKADVKDETEPVHFFPRAIAVIVHKLDGAIYTICAHKDSLFSARSTPRRCVLWRSRVASMRASIREGSRMER